MAIAIDAPAGVTLCARVGLDPETVRRFLRGEIPSSSLPEPAWGPLGETIYRRTYSRDVDGRQETWAETVRRVVNGNLGFVGPEHADPDEDVELFAAIYGFALIPAGRHLWSTGSVISKFSRNCWISAWSPRTSDHFRFLAARLFEGGGVGTNYSADLRSVTAPIVGTLEITFGCREDHPDYEEVAQAAGEYLRPLPPEGAEVYVVDDSREGWIDSWVRAIDLSTTPGNHKIHFDLSELRQHGAPLRTFGGRASGPAPLASTTIQITSVLNRSVGGKLSAMSSMEIDHHIAASVVAGGARRSARIALMHWDDPEIDEFLTCKADHSMHWSANISVEIDTPFREAIGVGDPKAHRILRAVAAGMAANGEPGLIDTDLHSADEPIAVRAVNPCGEASLPSDPKGGAAGQSCNLGSVNLEFFGQDIDGAAEAFRLLSRFLYRATHNPHHDPEAAALEAEARRIGNGFMGLQGWAASHGAKLTEVAKRPDLLAYLSYFRQVCRGAADELADDLGTPRPVKVTAVAPTGTIAQLAGTTPGLHPVFARHFIRRVRFTDTDPGLADEIAKGHRVIDDIYASNTKVVEYPQRDILLTRFPEGMIEQADEISAEQFMELVAAVQDSFCGYGDGQAVSATAQVPEGTDPDELAASLRRYLGRLKGFTVFPALSRPLSPYEAITKAEYLEMTSGLSVVAEVGDSNDGACAGGACPVR